MKTIKFLLCAVLSLLLSSILSAQIQVVPNGGVKIGTPPLKNGMSLPWHLTNKGLEVNVGEIRFHTANSAYVYIKEYTNQGKGGSVGGSPAPTQFALITGLGVKVGSAESRVWEVNTHAITTELQIQTVSDYRKKRNIESISEAKPYVMALRPVTYDLIAQEGYLGDTAELQNKAGFIAQEVLDVLPGAVGYSEEVDLYSLDYGYFIPYLTKTIQEQEEEISSLKGQLQASEERLERIEAILEAVLGDMPATMSMEGGQENDSIGNVNELVKPTSQTESSPLEQNNENGENNREVMEAKLWQNVPNPTNGNTVIRYELPANCKGRIVLTSSSGQALKIYNLPVRTGIGEIEVYGQSLNAGVYAYSLVVNGCAVDTKRMVLNK